MYTIHSSHQYHTLANRRIKGMRDTINNHATDPAAAQRLQDAFGPNYAAHIGDISTVVGRLESDNLNIKSADASVADAQKGKPSLAWVSSVKNGDGSYKEPGPAFLGSRFHNTLKTPEHRAGALIHEATHQQSLTGDHYDKSNNAIIPTGDLPAGVNKANVVPNGGCT
jgi:hypothetical protein